MQVTIITPTYNSASYIEKTINSVINQSFVDWKYILVDDCSTDNTTEIIESFTKDDSRITLIKKEKNGGAAESRNIGINEAEGKYIAFLDSDDLWLAYKLEIQLKFMEVNNVNFTFTNYFLCDAGTVDPFNSLLNKVQLNDIISFNYIACSTVVYNQQKLGKVFMPNIRNRQDWGLWIDLIVKNGSAICVPDYLMYYTVRHDSISSNKLKMVKFHWYIYKRHLGFTVIKAVFYLVKNIIMHMQNKRK